MLRERSEIIAFSRDDIERIARHIAKAQIVGSMFIGKFGEQSVRWTPDSGIEVITKYTEGDMDDVAPSPVLIDQDVARHAGGPGKKKKNR
jgi:hypothetical protein